MSIFTALICSIIISISQGQYTYHSWSPQKYVNYYTNPYFSAQLNGGENSEGDVVLTFHKKIRKEDNFQISVKYIDDNGAIVSEVVQVMNLCDHLEMTMKNAIALPNILGMNGANCPILIGDIKEVVKPVPFQWPMTLEFPEKIKCGVHNYHVTIFKCEPKAIGCQKLIEAGVESLLTSSENCIPGPVPDIATKQNNKIEKVSESRIFDTSIQQVDTITADNDQIIDSQLNRIDIVDGKVDHVKLTDEETGEDVHVINAEINKVSVIDGAQNVETINSSGNDINDGISKATITETQNRRTDILHHEEETDEFENNAIRQSEVQHDQIINSEINNLQMQDGQSTYDASSGMVTSNENAKVNIRLLPA